MEMLSAALLALVAFGAVRAPAVAPVRLNGRGPFMATPPYFRLIPSSVQGWRVAATPFQHIDTRVSSRPDGGPLFATRFVCGSKILEGNPDVDPGIVKAIPERHGARIRVLGPAPCDQAPPAIPERR